MGAWHELPPFKLDRPLILRPFPNGGWVVEQTGGLGCENIALGAFSRSEDLLHALSVAFFPAPTIAPRKPTGEPDR